MRLVSRCLLAVVIACCMGSQTARAATNCVFETRGNTWFLRGDCQTNETLRIPDGFALDGLGHRITAVDPAGSHFLGAIVRNAGKTAHVRNLTVTTQGLVNQCDPVAPSDDRLRGILFDAASGTIVGNRVLNVNQGQSGCQEGNGIEVRNAPYDGNHPATTRVYIAGNRVEAYQKTGILVNGDVEVGVYGNRTVGFGPVNFIAQNGIQLGFGAHGDVKLNRVSQNIYLGAETQAAGILLLESDDGVEVALNRVEACDTGVSISTSDGVLMVANQVNDSARYGVIVLGDTNTLLGNRIEDTTGIGIYVDGMDNTLEGNRIRQSSELDVYNVGANSYAHNRCDSSSGAPVDCP